MNIKKTIITVSIISLILSSCTSFLLSKNELNSIIENEIIFLDGYELPDEAYQEFSTSEVLFIGENHNLIEHQQLLTEWVLSLHSEGYRQLLIECFQLFDWIITEYVNGEDIELPRYLSTYYGEILGPIRKFNQTVAKEERIQVHPVDINHDVNAYFRSLLEYANQIENNELIFTFVESAAIDDPEIASSQVSDFYTEISRNQEHCTNLWGKEEYQIIERMTYYQLETYPIRKIWNKNNNKATRLREDLIKTIVDSYLDNYPHKTIINMGGFHAQRNPRLGTKQEWLGEYLSTKSPYATGKTYLIYVNAYKGEHDNGNGKTTTFDLSQSSPKNELFRIMNERCEDKISFLPLSNSKFSSHHVFVNYRSMLRIFPPYETFDAFILLPEASLVQTNKQ